MNYTIYKCICNVTNKVYIGKTKIPLHRRFNEHVYSAFSRNSTTHFHRAIRKYGKDSFTCEVIESGIQNSGDAILAEIYWIDVFDSMTNGYNLTIGGDGKDGYVTPDHVKKSISVTKKTKRVDGQYVSKLAYKKRNSTLLTRDPNALQNIGLKSSLTQRNNGKSRGIKNGNATKVSLYDSNGNIVFSCDTCNEFKLICKERGFPVRVLEQSYQNGGNPIYKTATTPRKLKTSKYRGYYAKYSKN